MNVSDMALFRKTHGHAADSATTASPDPEELQRLLLELAEAIKPLPARHSDHEFRIRNFRSDRLELVDDLIIVLEDRGDGQYVVTSYDTGQYGHGYSPDTAIQHLCSVLEDYYDLLREDEGQLSPRLNDHLRYLRSILRERKCG